MLAWLNIHFRVDFTLVGFVAERLAVGSLSRSNSIWFLMHNTLKSQVTDNEPYLGFMFSTKDTIILVSLFSNKDNLDQVQNLWSKFLKQII